MSPAHDCLRRLMTHKMHLTAHPVRPRGFGVVSRALLWGAAVTLGMALAAPGFEEETDWRYFKGTQPASEPDPTAWRQPDFPDQGWLTGLAPFFYEDKAAGYTGNTRLNDMRGNYLTLFLRKSFEVLAPQNVRSLQLDLRVDDGCVVWLNGQEIARVNLPAGELTHTTPAVNADNNPNVFRLTRTDVGGLLRSGINVLAVQAANISLAGSSDFLFAAQLILEVDDRPPQVEAVSPPPGARVSALTSVNVLFNREVTGVDAADLRVNGAPATGLEIISPREYEFRFPEPPEGVVTFAWADAHGITDTTPERVPFTGTSWSCTLDKTLPPVRVVISEFLAENRTGLRDRDGDRSDWIELRNLGDEPVSLAGWFLTDTAANPGQWRLPEVILPARSYLLVWASGKDRRDPAGELHTNFRLASDGEYLGLFDPGTNAVFEFAPVYPPQRSDISYGVDPVDPQVRGFFPTPTPGAPNVPGGSGFAPDPVVSLPGGLYVSNQVTVSLSAPAGVIYYSTDGRAPVPGGNGLRYTGPLTFTRGTVLMARVYQEGLLPSRVVAEGYYLVAANLADFSSNLPLLILQPAQGTLQPDARLPVYVTAIEPHRGRAALLGTASHRGPGLMEIRGQSSLGFPKRQYNLELNDALGADLEAPLLGLPPESDWVLHGPYSDKSFLNNVLAFELHEQMGHYAPRRRLVEVFVDETGGVLTRTTDYRGIYVLLEKIKIDGNRVNVARLSSAHTQEPEITGGYIFKKDKDSPGDLNFSTRGGAGFGAQRLKYHDPKPREITPAQQAWLRNYLNAFEEALYASNWLTRTGSQHYAAFIDVASFVDNHWIVEFTKQIDGYRLSNYLHKDRGGKVKMSPIWDWNLSLGNADYLEGWNPQGWYWPLCSADDHLWLRRLISGAPSAGAGSGDPDFNQAIADRWSALRTNIFNPTNVLARLDELAGLLNEAQARDFQRWPRLNQYVWPNPPIYIQPTYAQIIANKKQWIRDRFAWIDSQYLRAPTFDRPGGWVRPGTRLTLTGPTGATMFFTLDGSDPRLSGGGFSPRASVYVGPVLLDRSARVFARARQGNTWSGPAVATFVTARPPLRISELMYHPPASPDAPPEEDPNDYEFIELVNTGREPLALAGFRFTAGIRFDFSTSAVASLAPGARVLVVANRAAFERRHGAGLPVAGEYEGRLDNAGETVRLIGPLEELVQEFRYDRWYPSTDGAGFALVPMDWDASPSVLSTAAGWRPGSVPGGTPGAEEPPAPPRPPILITEVLAKPGPGRRDAIELFNPTGAPVDISGWYLSDRRRQPKYALPAGTVIGAGEYLVVDASQFNPPGGGANSFGLSAGGEEVWVFSADAAGRLSGYQHGFSFGPAPAGMTLGLHRISTGDEQVALLDTPTLGAANAGPWVSPVVFSEIMYHPPDVWTNGAFWDAPEHEYLELVNHRDQAVPLFDPAAPINTWKVRGAVEFTLPENIVLAPGERLVLVSFDPQAEPARANEFRERYGALPTLRLLGPWQGKLDNSGESLELIQPVALGTDAESPTAELVVDRVEYRDRHPWPAGADGFGPALQRRPESAYGNAPASWGAAVPTPGGPALEAPLPRILSSPARQVTVAGRTVTLSVLATGEGPLSFQWRKDDQPLVGATNATLVLTNIQPNQAGEYQVVVLNPAGAVATVPVPIRVAAAGADTDADGLDDLYELTHGLDPTWPDGLNADPDGDGLTTGQEYGAGTDPLDPSSRLAIGGLEITASGVQLRFEAANNRAYHVEWSDRLNPGEPWKLLNSIGVHDPGSAALRPVAVTDTNQPRVSARFYRLRVNPQ